MLMWRRAPGLLIYNAVSVLILLHNQALIDSKVTGHHKGITPHACIVATSAAISAPYASRLTLAHLDPFHDVLTVTRNLLPDFESLRFIDHGFQPDDRTGLVIHFEPVLFDVMFDARPGNPFQEEIGNIY
jgi:hypothetical protein